MPFLRQAGGQTDAANGLVQALVGTYPDPYWLDGVCAHAMSRARCPPWVTIVIAIWRQCGARSRSRRVARREREGGSVVHGRAGAAGAPDIDAELVLSCRQ